MMLKNKVALVTGAGQGVGQGEQPRRDPFDVGVHRCRLILKSNSRDGGGGGKEEHVGATEYMQTFLVLFGKQGAAPLLLGGLADRRHAR